MDNQPRVFRPGMLEGLWLSFVSAALPITTYIVTSLIFNNPITLSPFTLNGVLVLVLATAIFAVWFSKTTVKLTGIHGYNAIGLFRDIPWNSMERVTRFNLFGLKYLRIHTNNGRWVLWFPLFHLQQKELEQAILAYTPQNHILREYLPSKPNN